MQISSRFTIALHIFSVMDTYAGRRRITSEFLADSIGTNPVVVRRIVSQLREAGLVLTTRGSAGVEPARRPEDITFLDVYRAIEPTEGGELFRFHEAPNPECEVGGHIHDLLDDTLHGIQDAMEAEMARHTIAELQADMRSILAREAGEGTE